MHAGVFHSKKSSRHIAGFIKSMNDLLCRLLKKKQTTVGTLIFSKDRPLQLASLLRSMEYYCKGIAEVYVLYSVSNRLYAEGYEELSTQFPGVKFRREQKFHEDTIAIGMKMSHRHIFFLVDDIIFIDEFDASITAGIDLSNYILSLRLHPGVTYSYMTGHQQTPPSLIPYGSGLLAFTWDNISTDWSYPLSVDGHIFERKFILRLIKKCKFRAPNSMESSLQAYTKKVKKLVKGLCFKRPKIINLPVNRVQTEFNNRAGEQSPEYFLELFRAGFEIDFRKFEKASFNSVHMDIALPVIKR